jgi:hypothetical protein
MKTKKIDEQAWALLRLSVRGDVTAVAFLEQVAARVRELEEYVAGMGPPLMPRMG